jgi:hypothetical protein
MAYLQNFMIETTEIYDYRMNKSADRFFAGTIKHKLILKTKLLNFRLYILQPIMLLILWKSILETNNISKDFLMIC